MTTTDRPARPAPGAGGPHTPSLSNRPRREGTHPAATSARNGDARRRGRTFVEAALAAYGERLAAAGPPRLATEPEANALIAGDPFALLVGVLADQGVAPDRAWGLPLALRARLGHLDPARIAADPEAVHAAFREPPMLHRFTKVIAGWVVDAAVRLRDQYGGDAGAVWAGAPPVADVVARLRAFPGIGKAKAAKAVGILAHGLGVPLAPAEGDNALDPDVARVLARTGLGPDTPTGPTPPRVAAPAHRHRPLWEVGRRWCAPVAPDCPSCALAVVCPGRPAPTDAGPSPR